VYGVLVCPALHLSNKKNNAMARSRIKQGLKGFTVKPRGSANTGFPPIFLSQKRYYLLKNPDLGVKVSPNATLKHATITKVTGIKSNFKKTRKYCDSNLPVHQISIFFFGKL
jgi:hypothetical protein